MDREKVQEQVVKFCNTCLFDNEQITIESLSQDLEEIQIDDLDLIEISMDLEEFLNVTLRDEKCIAVKTLNELIDYALSEV